MVVLGLITIWTTRRFFTLELALSEGLVRVAVTSASAADVSAVYIPPDVIAPAEALQRTETGTLSPACVRPNAWNRLFWNGSSVTVSGETMSCVTGSSTPVPGLRRTSHPQRMAASAVRTVTAEIDVVRTNMRPLPESFRRLD